MTEKKEPKGEKAEKPKAAKKPAAPKAEKAALVKAAAPAKKEAAPKAEKPAPSKKEWAGKTITVQQIGSPIGRQGYQRGTLIGLGLNKMHKTRTLEDTPSVRGMVESVKHLVKIVE